MVPLGRKATILVVEDDPALRTVYRAALTAAGYAVIAVEDGLDALRQIDLKAPNAVLLDLGLPRVNGGDVHRQLRGDANTRHIPIVIVTGNDSPDVSPTDVDCVLRKPVSLDKLVEAIEACLRKQRQPRDKELDG